VHHPRCKINMISDTEPTAAWSHACRRDEVGMCPHPDTTIPERRPCREGCSLFSPGSRYSESVTNLRPLSGVHGTTAVQYIRGFRVRKVRIWQGLEGRQAGWAKSSRVGARDRRFAEKAPVVYTLVYTQGCPNGTIPNEANRTFPCLSAHSAQPAAAGPRRTVFRKRMKGRRADQAVISRRRAKGTQGASPLRQDVNGLTGGLPAYLRPLFARPFR